MSLRVTCPGCKTAVTVNDDKRGGKIRCKQCEKAITVPAGSNGKAKPRVEDDEFDFRSPAQKNGAAKKKSKKGGFPVLLVAGGGAAALLLLVLAAAGVGAYLYWRKPADPAPTPLATAEPTVGTEHKIKEEPKKDSTPAPKKDPEPVKTGPAPAPALSPELQKVKDATVFISADKLRSAGSGFFAVEPGLVLTTAAVLGMTDPNSPPPQKIEVYWNVGTPDEVRSLGELIAVDPVNNLAALRVDGKMPAPLPFEDAGKIAESQNVQIAGFPFGKTIAKDFALTPTAIAKIKKDGGNLLAEIQVNEGMNRGNAGGPVVTPQGNVVGVGTGAQRDPQVHTAIPNDVVKRFLDPRIGDVVFGKPFMQNGQTKVPTKYPLNDPLGRIKDVRAETWTGPPGPPRPYSYQPPVPVNGDGPRMPQPLNKDKGAASNDLVMPATIPTGQVVWVQSIITCSDNTMQWSVATPISLPPTSPYQLVPANLTLNLTTPKERTVQMKYTFTPGMGKAVSGDTAILEVMGPDAAGAQTRTAYGNLNFITDPAGGNMPAMKPILDLVHQIPTTYAIDATGLIRRRADRPFDKDPPANVKEQSLDQQAQMGAALEATMVPMPNRTVQPGENWPVTYFLRARAPKKPGDNIQVTLTATYEGMQKKDDRNEAVITLTGKTSTTNPDLKNWTGNITGKLGFDTAGGYLSSGKLTLQPSTNTGNSLDIDFQRSAGNPMNIQFPQAPTAPPPPPPPPPPPLPKKTKPYFEKKESLTTKDPGDPQFSDTKKKQVAHMKVYPIQLTKGKTYTFTLDSGAFDAYLRINSANGVQLAVDDNSGGGTNAKISGYRPPTTGQYFVVVISHNGKVGAFHLTVSESP